jgi:regulator of sigma E protease
MKVCLTDNVYYNASNEMQCRLSNQDDMYSIFIEDDIITKINGVVITNWADVASKIKDSESGESIEFEIIRDTQTISITVINPWGIDVLNTQGLPMIDSSIGVGPTYSFAFGKSVAYGFTGIKNSSTMIFDTLALLFDSDQVGVSDLAGPVGIYQITSSALSQGFVSLLAWVGLLSVNLGVINLLPIPALDGGRLVFLGYEALSGHKPNQKVENTLHYVMYLLLMGLFVFITYNDILRLIGLK